MRRLSRWSVVVPTNRPEKCEEFYEAWLPLFRKHDVSLHIVTDGETAIDPNGYCWADIPNWIPRKTDMIRSWGIYKAWKHGSDFTLSLDDDVRPEGDPFAEFEAVFDAGAPCSEYLDVGALTSYDGQLRGFPFRDRVKSEVAVQYGGWHGVLDFDAPTQLATSPGRHSFANVVLPVPRGAAVTGCIMNCAWRTEFAPIMWQLPLLDGKYNRFGDIWSGLIQKRVLDAIGKVMVVNGKASVLHERASDPIANLEREAAGVRPNENLWQNLPLLTLSGTEDDSFLKSYEITTRLVGDYFRLFYDEEYAVHFLDCRDKWLALFA